MSVDQADSSTKGYIKQFTELETAISKARQAYDEFKNEMEQKKEAGQTLTSDETKALEASEEELGKAIDNKKLRESQIIKSASLGLTHSIEDLELLASGRELSPHAKAVRGAEQLELQ